MPPFEDLGGPLANSPRRPRNPPPRSMPSNLETSSRAAAILVSGSILTGTGLLIAPSHLQSRLELDLRGAIFESQRRQRCLETALGG